MLRNYSLLATFLWLTFKARPVFIQSLMVSSASSNRCGAVVEITEFAVFPLLYIFLSFRNEVDVVVVRYDNTPFWISADSPTPIRLTLNDPETPDLT